MTVSELKNTTVASINDGGKNKADKVRGVLNSIIDYTRQNGSLTITHVDCTLLAGRTYQYQILDPSITTLVVDGSGAANGGVILNKIIPHVDTIDGQELTLTFLNGGGLTFLTRNGVTSNIIFIVSNSVTPNWGDNNFIAQNNANTRNEVGINNVGIGYEKNLKVLLKWNSSLNRWIEIHRSGGNIY